MSRILRRLDDYRPLYQLVMAAPQDHDIVQLYRGTALIKCRAADCTCAVIVIEPLTTEVIMELVDEGWAYNQGKMYCLSHSDVAA